MVIGRTFNEHLLNLELVFNRFRYARLKLKPKKCKLFQSELSYLGRIVSGDQVKIDETKVACVKYWPFPRNIAELRSWLGFTSYYSTHIKNYSQIAEPLNEMLRKNVPVTPNKDRLRAFETLKNILTSPPALALFRDEGEIVIDVDASNFALGAVCSQWQDGRLRVIKYASRCLSQAERNLCASRREMAGLIFALKHFRRYLLGRHFVCRVDNMALSYCQKQTDPTAQICRYLDLADYKFSLEFRSGRSNGNADGLSRLRPCE